MSLGSRFLLEPEPLPPPEPWPATNLIWLCLPEGPHPAAGVGSHPVPGAASSPPPPWCQSRPRTTLAPPTSCGPGPAPPFPRTPLLKLLWMTPKLFSRPSPSPPTLHKERPHNFQPPDKFFFFLKKKQKTKKSVSPNAGFTSPTLFRWLDFFLLFWGLTLLFLFYQVIVTWSPFQLFPAQIRKLRCWWFSGFHFPSCLNTKKELQKLFTNGKAVD